MRIAFCSIDALRQGLDQLQPTHVLSVWTPKKPTFRLEGFAQRHFCFHDVELWSPQNARLRFVTDDLVREIVEIEEQAPERLLIHCTAGLSRSPAFAIVAAITAGHDVAATCAEVRRLVPHAQPNRRILALADVIMGTAILAAAEATFTYDRGDGLPQGDRAGLCELFTDHATPELASEGAGGVASATYPASEFPPERASGLRSGGVGQEKGPYDEFLKPCDAAAPDI